MGDIKPKNPLTILGLGAMGSAIANRLRSQGHPTTVWNRTVEKVAPHAAAGSSVAETVGDAVGSTDVTLVVLLDHASVREQLDPVADRLQGKTVVNLTTTSPNEARESAQWAQRHGITYVDGAIMAVPEMIGGPNARLLYSGDRAGFESTRPVLESLGGTEFVGDDAGFASLKDMALLSAMDLMFAGLIQAVAMMRTVDVGAVATSEEVTAWLEQMLPHLRGLAETIEDGTYGTGGQNVDFTGAASASMITASREQGIRADLLEPMNRLLNELSATGHGTSDWTRIVESLTIR